MQLSSVEELSKTRLARDYLSRV